MEEMMPSKPYECKMLDLLSDCQWNPRYNMFAVSGFGQQFPLLIYVFARTEDELDRILLSGAGVQMGSDRAIEYNEARRRELRNINDEDSMMGSRMSRKGRNSVRNDKNYGSNFSRRSMDPRGNRSVDDL